MEHVARILGKSKLDLTITSQLLDYELQQSFSDGENPWKIMLRVNRVKDEFPKVMAELNEVMEARDRIIEAFERNFVALQKDLRSLQVRAGMPTDPESEDLLAKAKEVWHSAYLREAIETHEEAEDDGDPNASIES